jgi:hypothetical protein
MRWRTLLAGAVLTCPGLARGQESFTRQVILVPMFQGKDRRLADAAGDAVRARIGRGVRKTEATVVDEGRIGIILSRASIDRSTSDTFHIRSLAREVRADEIIEGEIQRISPTRVRAWGRISLTRDRRLIQPLAAVEAPNADSAGALLAAGALALRRQMNPLRRCENALREGAPERAVQDARAGVAAVPDGVMVRTCLVSAMLANGAPANELLAQAREVLRRHPESWWGMDGAAKAHDALGQRAEAAAMWLRLVATDTTDLLLGRRVATALLHGGNAAHAVPLTARLVELAPDDTEILRLQWQALAATSAWEGAVKVGTRLYVEDPTSRDDSAFVWRYALAQRAFGDTLRAMAVAADGAARFPKDSRLYLLYADLVRTDGRVAVARGVERFPEVAELRLLRAQELRTAGKTAEAVSELQLATTLDSSLGQGHLALAQAHAELGALDSALAEAHRAVASGADRSAVVQFVLARGNAVYRAANATRQRADFQRAFGFLSYADSLQSTPQSQFLLGATALAISQQAATEAPETKACDLSRLASGLLPLAREKITSGARIAPDASRQYLDYLDQLEPVVARQLEVLCAPGPLAR